MQHDILHNAHANHGCVAGWVVQQYTEQVAQGTANPALCILHGAATWQI